MMVSESESHGDELGQLRASSARLVRAVDADRRRLERELHDGLQQRLVALAVELQLAESSAGFPGAAERLADARRDVDEALDEARRLAERLHAPLELGGLAVALRAAAASGGTPATVDVADGSSYPDAVARTIYLCWLEALDAASGGAPTIRGREEDGVVAFELSAGTAARAGLERLRDRVEALGGRLEVDAAPSGGLRASGSLPL
jgi:signal transduction histidine kinase